MRKVITLFMVLMLSFNVANAAIRVSPSYIELDANKGNNKDYISSSFTVTGGKDETVRFKLYPVYFQYDKNGHFVELEDKNQKNSLLGKIQYYPKNSPVKMAQSKKSDLQLLI